MGVNSVLCVLPRASSNLPSVSCLAKKKNPSFWHKAARVSCTPACKQLFVSNLGAAACWQRKPYLSQVVALHLVCVSMLFTWGLKMIVLDSSLWVLTLILLLLGSCQSLLQLTLRVLPLTSCVPWCGHSDNPNPRFFADIIKPTWASC